MKNLNILVTGASGYVGGRLVPELLSTGYSVRAMARSPEKLVRQGWEIYRNCQRRRSSTRNSGESCRGYRRSLLSYPLNDDFPGRTFAENDLVGAVNFAKACEKAGVKRIIYLGGLGTPSEGLSRHLSSRHDTGAALSLNFCPCHRISLSYSSRFGKCLF